MQSTEIFQLKTLLEQILDEINSKSKKEPIPDLTALFFTPTNHSSSDLIVFILSQEWPLSLKQIYFRMQKLGKDCSYQAVHKSVSGLTEKNVISKNDNKYLLAKKFILQLGQYSDFLKVNYKLSTEKTHPDETCFHPSVFDPFEETKKQKHLSERMIGLQTAKEFFQ